jgi:hypothetical protein
MNWGYLARNAAIAIGIIFVVAAVLVLVMQRTLLADG